MTQEDKELLLQDLCARLPYKVKVYNTTFKEPTIQTLYGKISKDEFLMKETYTSVGVDGDDFGSFSKKHCSGYIDFIKPYLRPMSSMTEEEFSKLKEYSGLIYDQLDLTSFQDDAYKCLDFYLSEVPTDVVILVFDWLNAHHFDYRGLIERGLAIEAPEGMYK